MKAQDYKVSGIYLRGYLAGVRKLTGKQYPRLLAQCGLGNYAEKYPASNLETAATGHNLTQLNQLVINYIGPDLFNLFLRNLGFEFARTVTLVPTLKTAIEEVGPVRDRSALAQVLNLILQLNQETLGEQIRLEEAANPNELLLVYRECLYCAHRGQVDKPACIVIPTFYKEIIHNLAGTRCHVEEIRCGAMHGERDCIFVVRQV